MYILISVFILIVAVLLVLIVLVQNSKGGGLASNFSASNQVMGVKKTTDFLEKATWTLSTLILVLCIAAAAAVSNGEVETESVIKENVENAIDPTQVPNFPTEMPAEELPSEDIE
jgi:preprotein translocase subunit SecG